MSEDFALDECFRNGCGVDCDEWPMGPFAEPMNGSRRQLFSRPALSRDDRLRVTCAQTLNQVIYLAHRLACPNELSETGTALEL